VTQQINLLIQKQLTPKVSAERTLIALALLLAASLTYAFIERRQTSKVVETATRGAAQLTAQKAAVKMLEKRLAQRPKGDELNAEVTWLRELAANKQRVLETLRAGTGGSDAGYHAHLVALARVSENGVWLNSLRISDAGTKVILAGQSLSQEAVIRYAQRLNEQFAPFGAKFTSLDITAPLTAPGMPPVVGFTLQ
jgi:hypothetical protein